MTDTPPTTSSPGSTPPSSASEQARIRRERREAKIKAGGTSRLNKITGLGGGLQRDDQPATKAPPDATSISHGDPDEVDISEHFYQPTKNPLSRNAIPNPNRPYPDFAPGSSQMDDQALRAMMLGLTPPGESPQSHQQGRPSNPFAAVDNPDRAAFSPSDNDPMMAMLQQMLGSVGGEPGAIPTFPGLPPMDFPDQNSTESVRAKGTSNYIWRLVHAVFTLSFGLYIAFTAEFMQTVQRPFRTDSNGVVDLRAFYIFATVEAMLQGTRLIFDREQTSPNGPLGMVLQFLPGQFKAYLKIFMNYRSIWTTTSADVLVLVFVLVTTNYWRASQEFSSEP